MLASGDLQLVILALLKDKPRHGYEIIKALEDHSQGLYTPSPGMVYPALTYLEEMGFAVSETEGTKKLYRVTDLGGEHFNKHRAEIRETMDELAKVGEKMARMREHAEDREAEEQKWESGSHDRRALKEDFRALKEDLKSAIFETIQAPLDEKKRVLAILRRALDEVRRKS
jgi:DNA-binding PadR family transcriptional regulator